MIPALLISIVGSPNNSPTLSNSVLIELEKMHSKKNDIYLKTYIKSLKGSKRGILR